MNGNCETISRFRTWGEAGIRGCRAGQGEVSGNAPGVGFRGPVTSLRLRAWGEVGTGVVGRPQRGLRKCPWAGIWGWVTSLEHCRESPASRPWGDCLEQWFSE